MRIYNLHPYYPLPDFQGLDRKNENQLFPNYSNKNKPKIPGQERRLQWKEKRESFSAFFAFQPCSPTFDRGLAAWKSQFSEIPTTNFPTSSINSQHQVKNKNQIVKSFSFPQLMVLVRVQLVWFYFLNLLLVAVNPINPPASRNRVVGSGTALRS